MKWKSDTKIKQGCYYPECEKPHQISRALTTLNQHSSNSSLPLSPFLALGYEQRKAVQAYKLQVEKRRSIAIEHARKNTYR